MKNLFVTILMGFLLISLSVFAKEADYSQSQNTTKSVDDDANPITPHPEMNKGHGSVHKDGAHPEGHPQSNSGSGSNSGAGSSESRSTGDTSGSGSSSKN